MKGKLAAAAALAAAVICAALAASTVASAGTDIEDERYGPLTLEVICVQLLRDAQNVDDKLWRVYFGYSTTSAVDPTSVKKSEFEDAPGWTVVAGNAPGTFVATGFGATGGNVVVAIVAENGPGFGAESITWDVDLYGPHAFGPKKARFDGDSMSASECPPGVGIAEEGVERQEPVRAIYCSAAGNTVNGVPVSPGTALNLRLGQPSTDPSYKGATPAIFVEGIGATCDPPPAGYTFHGTTYVDGAGVAHGLENAIYPFYEQP